MNVSGKTSSLAPLPAASAARRPSFSTVASRSRMTGSAWTHATVTPLRMQRIVREPGSRRLADAEARVHAARPVVGDRAPEAVDPGLKLHIEFGAPARLR